MRLTLGLTLKDAYVVNGGISEALALILYSDTLNNFVYDTDASGNAIITNQGSGSTAYDGLLNAGRAVELGATNTVDVPIHHTLGSEDFTNGTFDSDTDWTKGTEWTISGGEAHCDGTQPGVSYFYQSSDVVTGNSYKITYEITAYTSGTIRPLIGGTPIGTSRSSIGVYTEDILAVSSGSSGLTADADFVGSIDNVSVKQITNPNSFLTYHDLDTNTVTQVDNSANTPSTTYTFVSKTVNNILTHSTAFDTASMTALNANPNLLAKLAMDATGSIDELNVTLGASDAWYACSEESGAYLVDARATVSSSNLALYSEEIDNAYWLKRDTTISTNATTAPDGTTTADLVYPTTTGDYRWVWRTPAVIAAGSYHVQSFYAKTAGFQWVGIDDGGGTGGVYFDIVNGVVGYEGTDYRGLIENVGDGWYRCTAMYSGTAKSAFPAIKLADSNGTATATTNGTDGAYIWGIQVEEDIYPTEYTKTTSAVVNGTPYSYTEIANYASTVRTNADQLTTGLQSTCLTLDGAGVPTVYTEGQLEWHGNEFMDCQFMPPSDSAWELDIVVKTSSTPSNTYFCGAYAANTPLANSFFIGQSSSSNKISAYIGSKNVVSTSTFSDEFNHIRLEFNGSGNGNMVINNSETIAYTASDYTYLSGESFFIGGLSRTGVIYSTPYHYEHPTGYFQYTNKVRTADERTADYAKAKAMHPTLP